ncbi:Fc.00g001600.m01.CDS01 [Cosmosporella sp. VM-42]
MDLGSNLQTQSRAAEIAVQEDAEMLQLMASLTANINHHQEQIVKLDHALVLLQDTDVTATELSCLSVSQAVLGTQSTAQPTPRIIAVLHALVTAGELVMTPVQVSQCRVKLVHEKSREDKKTSSTKSLLQAISRSAHPELSNPCLANIVKIGSKLYERIGPRQKWPC